MAVRIVLSQVGFLIFLLIAGIYLYFFHQNPPFVVYSAATDKEIYEQGETIRISIDGHIRAQVPTVTRFELRDNIDYELPIFRAGAVPEGPIQITLPRLAVPLTAIPGEYYVQASTSFKVNFLATRVVEWRTNPFKVIQVAAGTR